MKDALSKLMILFNAIMNLVLNILKSVEASDEETYSKIDEIRNAIDTFSQEIGVK